MASLSKAEGGFRIQFFDRREQRRKSLYLGQCSQKTGESIRLHVERLLTAKLTNTPLDEKDALWLKKVDDTLYAKLAVLNLCDPRPTATEIAAGTLGQALEVWIASRPDLQPGTQTNMKVNRDRMLAHFDAALPVATLTAEMLMGWVADLRKQDYAPATVSKTIRMARNFFKFCRKKGWRADLPLEEYPTGKENNPARQRFIPRADIAKLMTVLPDHEWRLLVGLSRYAGLRVPSEALRLTWEDVLWDQDKMRVFAPKTGEWRLVPIFAELRPLLQEAWDRAEGGQPHVITRYRLASCNLRTQFNRYVARAGLKAWPRPFHNMRSSVATELVGQFPGHVAAAWLGHSEAIADAHYRQVLEEHFRKAVQNPVQPCANSCAAPASRTLHRSQGKQKTLGNPRVLQEAAEVCSAVQCKELPRLDSNQK